jgi:hypothetical protein
MATMRAVAAPAENNRYGLVSDYRKRAASEVTLQHFKDRGDKLKKDVLYSWPTK